MPLTTPFSFLHVGVISGSVAAGNGTVMLAMAAGGAAGHLTSLALPQIAGYSGFAMPQQDPQRQGLKRKLDALGATPAAKKRLEEMTVKELVAWYEASGQQEMADMIRNTCPLYSPSSMEQVGASGTVTQCCGLLSCTELTLLISWVCVIHNKQHIA